MKHPLTLLSLLLLSAAGYAQMPPVAVDPPPPPTVQLPPMNPANVAKFDATKVKELPWHVTQNKAPEAWAKNPLARGKGLRVAVIDTGCQVDHPALKNCKIVATYNAFTKKEGAANVADGHSHGTFCLHEIYEMLPEAEFVVVKGLSDKGSGTTDVLAHGIDWASSPTGGKAHVLSMSFGGAESDPYQPAAVKRAIERGCIPVAAAGNEGGGPGRDTQGYPSRLPGVIAVAAATRGRQLAEFSSWGPTVITTDFGQDIEGILTGGMAGTMSGTSMSCPLFAAKAGMWLLTHPDVPPAERLSRFTADLIAGSPFKERNNARGYGLVTADKLVGDPTATPPPVKPAPGEKVYTLSLAELVKQGYTAVRIDLGGTPAASGQPIPVASFPPPQPAQPQPVFAGPGSVYQGHYPPPVVYHQMPQTCPPGGCQPAPQPQYLFAPFGGRFR